jgi:hypothetical protein
MSLVLNTGRNAPSGDTYFISKNYNFLSGLSSGANVDPLQISILTVALNSTNGIIGMRARGRSSPFGEFSNITRIGSSLWSFNNGGRRTDAVDMLQEYFVSNFSRIPVNDYDSVYGMAMVDTVTCGQAFQCLGSGVTQVIY